MTAENGLKVWIKGRPAKIFSNKVLVAYGSESSYGPITAAVGDFSETFQKNFREEQYSFNVSYIYNAESFAVGRKAKVVLHGRLSINNTLMSLALLHNIKVRVILTSSEQIKIAYNFDIAEWSDASDPIIEFPIQSYISAVSIEVSGQITLLNKKEVTVSNSKEIEIDLAESRGNFLDFYLDRDSKGIYRISLLGANGEPPLTNVDVIIQYYVIGVDVVEKK